MDYQKHYELLIGRAKNRVISGYFEVHHILPRCMGGSDIRSNLANLTPEEHFVAHQLLCKIHPNVANLAYALARMTGNPRTNNKLYGWMRKRIAAASSVILKKSLSDSEFLKKAREARIKALKDPQHRQKMSEIMFEVNKNVPEVEKKRRKNRNSEKSKEYHANLSLKKKEELYERIDTAKKENGSYEKWASMISENRKKYWNKVRQEGTMSELTKRMVESRRAKSGYIVSPEARKKISASSRRMWEDRREKGGYKTTFVPNEEQRRKMSEASKAYWASKKKKEQVQSMGSPISRPESSE